MDGFEEQGPGASGTPGGGSEETPKLSAAFLPYDDQRLWVGMPVEQRGKRRSAKRRPPKRAKERTPAEGTEPTRSSRLSRPISFGRRQIAAAIVALALPVSAFAITGVLSRDVVLPGPAIANSPSLSPVPVTIDVVGLRAESVTPKRVALTWEIPALDGPLTYLIYRDGVVIAETTDPAFVDGDVIPQRYYYYAVATVASDGTAASSPQLLVAVPSETGELPEGPAPAAPAPIVVVVAPSPSPSKTPSPTKSKIVWPSTDFGGGGGGGGGVTTTTPPPIDCTNPQNDPSCPGYTTSPPPIDCSNPQNDPSCPGYIDCSNPQNDPSCPGYVDPCNPPVEGCPGYTPPSQPTVVVVPWLPPLVLWGSQRRRRRGRPTRLARRWPSG